MMESSNNNINIHVLNLLPNIKDSSNPDQLLDNISINQYLIIADEINQLQLANSNELSEDIEQILRVDDSNYKGIGFACIASIHTYNGNYKKACIGFKNALDQIVNDDVKSYILAEYSNLLRKLFRTDEALVVLNKALRMTDNDRLQWRILTCKGYCYKNTDYNTSLDLLNKSSKYYLDNGDFPRYLTASRHIGAVHVINKDHKLAKNILSNALSIAEEHSFESIVWDIKNDFGWIHIKENNFESARNIYLELLTKKLNPYMFSLVSQNLGYVAFECNNYSEAIKYYNQSLPVTSKYEMTDMLFEDYFKLGISYEYMGEYEKAYQYFGSGYYLLLNERNSLGIKIFTGYRQELEDNYLRFLSDRKDIAHVRQNDQSFKFAIGKTYREILNIFQKNLLILHRNREKTIQDLCKSLDISLRLYFVYQKRLGVIKKITDISADNDQQFNHYIYFMLSYDWRSAIIQFDKDLYSFLLKKHQHNKTKIAKILDVSNLTVIKKTANID